MSTIEGFRLSAQQRGLWLRQGGAALAAACVVDVEGEASAQRVEAALRRVVERHEILRTRYRCLPGMEVPIQVIGEAPEIDFSAADISSADLAAGDAAVADEESWLQRLTAAPFDLEDGPTLRAALLHGAAGRSRLALAVPALAADAASLARLVVDLAAALHPDAAAEGADEEGGEVVQYADFAEWQHEEAEGEETEEARRYWARRDFSAVADLRLPAERAAEGPYAPRSLGVPLEPAVLARAAALAGELEVPAAVVLSAAWQALLARLTGSGEVTVGYLFDGRGVELLESAVGPYAHCVPLTARPAAHLTLRELAEQVAGAWREARQHQAGFSAERHPALADGGFPFVVETAPPPVDVRADGLRLSMARRLSPAGRHLVSLSVGEAPAGGAAAVRLDYDAARLPRPAAERLAAAFATVLASGLSVGSDEAAGRAPRLGDLEMAGDEERRLLAAAARGPLPSWSFSGDDLAARFAAQAARHAQRPALVADGRTWSFGELDAAANRLARHLSSLGVGPDRRVGLCLPRCGDMVVALLATWKAGGAYLPLDPDLPPARLELMVRDAAATAVVTRSDTADRLPPGPWAAVDLSADADAVAALPATPPALAADPRHLAYVLYTSGSTGRPKGVMVTRGAVLHLLAALDGAGVFAGDGEAARVTVNAPFAFDASVKQIARLLRGDALVLVPEEVRPDGAALRDWLAESAIDAFDCTPQQLALLDQAGLVGEPGAPHTVLLGGEAVAPALWRRLAADPHRRYFNVYGPTEVTVDATVRPVDGDAPALGSPIGATAARVLAPGGLTLQPLGVAGELCLGGPGLARGYLASPAVTAQRFVPDPFGDEPGGRLYRSGDLVRLEVGAAAGEDGGAGKDGAAGELRYLGRLDGQVKLRGLRIELGEVEAALARREGVRQAAAMVREDVAGDARLVGYVVPRRAAAPGGAGASHHRLPNGLVVAQQNRNETEYLYQEIFTSRSYLRHGMELPEEPVVFDVGANIGMFTLFVAGHRPGAQVYAFEPIGPIYETLQANARAYAPGAKLFRHGLSSEESTATFSYYPGYSMMSGLAAYADAAGEVEVIERFLRNEQAQGEEGREELLAELEGVLEGRFQAREETARLRRLADVVAEEGVECIDLLKVDVQRAELDVLRGLDDAAWAKVQQVVMEVHDLAGGATEGRVGEIRALLEGHGFHVLVEQDEVMAGTDRYAVYAARHELTEGAETELVWRLEATPDDAPSPAELREALKAELPDYMVPSAVVVLDELPLTRNGKVDRAALPAPEETAAGEGTVTLPRTVVEETLCGIWADVLHREQVGIDESFFELGGHSLLATQLVSRVREAFDVELPLRSLFTAPTVAELALEVESVLRGGGGVEAPPLVAVDRSEALPLSFAQQRLWFLHRLDPASAQYNNLLPLRLAGDLDVAALAAALGEVVRRHEVLRTVFAEGDDGPLQVIRAPGALLVGGRLPLPVVDLTTLEPERREAVARRLAADEARRAFDLQAGPLLRLLLLRFAAADHAALLAVHHAVADAWSVARLVEEVEALYPVFAAGRPAAAAELAPLAVQYADYAAWQRRYLSGDALAAQLDFWRRHLEGAPALLDLPTDRPRPARPRHPAGRVPVELSAELRGLLRRTALESRTTPFVVLLAAFSTLMARWSGQWDVVVGTPVAGRTRTELEPLVGFFLNTLPQRSRLAPEVSFADAVAAARESVLDAHVHQDLPFEKLVEELDPERHLGVSPLFQVLFTLQNVGAADLELPGLEVAGWEVAAAEAKVDLSLAFGEHGDRLLGGLEYDAELFDAATAERMARCFVTLLRGALETPETRLADLPLLGDDERAEILQTSRRRGDAYAARPVHAAILERGAETPAAPAVEMDGESLTYGELRRRSLALAARLAEMGVGAGDRVGLFLPRTPRALVAMLGVHAAGAAYVPLDPAQPRRRLLAILEDAGVAALLTDGAAGGEAPPTPAPVLDLEAFLAHDAGAVGGAAVARAEAVAEAVDPDQLAYVIFTSGSTGRPKGVAVSHRALANFLVSMLAEPGIGADDVLLAVTTLSFDISGLELLAPLLAGGRVALADADCAADGTLLSRRLAASGASVLQGTPATWRLLLDAGWQGDPRLTALCGGEALPAELAARLVPKVGALWNMYGPTETTIWSATRRVGDGEAPVRLGGAVANTGLLVVDPELRPVPDGVVGEMLIAGHGLARGYLGRPARTAAAFVPDPFAGDGEAGGRLYRTGDLVRRRPDGTFLFAGRRDHQVKVRGFRIECGEVERALEELPGVAQAVVTVQQAGAHSGGGDARLVAWWVGETGEGAAALPSAAELRERLAAVLPAYMVPSFLIAVDALPLNPSGKVDRGALTARALPDEVPAASWTAPRSGGEEMLAEIWGEVLGRERIGADDDFFALGGHSLLAARVSTRVRRALGVELPVRAVFEAPTLRVLARRVEELRHDEAAAALPPLQPADRSRPLPLSFPQLRLWLLDRLQPGSAAYNMPLALRLEGRLDAVALSVALGRLTARHEVLRTRFVDAGDEPVQVVDPPAPFPLPYLDLAALPAVRRAAELVRLARGEARRPFDLAADAVLRGVLVRVAGDDHALLLTVHHVAADDASLSLMRNEVAAFYAEAAGGPPAVLPELPVQYADYAAWQRRALGGEVMEAQLDHWRRALAGAPQLIELPTDRPRPARPSQRGARVEAELAADAAEALARHTGATRFMVLLALFQALLARFGGDRDLVVGTPVAGRDRRQVEDLVGFFVNTLVVRSRVDDGAPFGDLVEQVRQGVLAALSHQHVPFERLVDELVPERHLSHPPLFQVLFVYQRHDGETPAIPGLTLRPVEQEVDVARYELTLAVRDRGGRLSATLEYARDLFDAATAEALLDGYQRLLASAAAAPRTALGELPLLSAAQRRQLLEEWGTGSPAAAPGDAVPVHRQIAALAAAAPDLPALAEVTADAASGSPPRTVSRGELAATAAALAAHLRADGVDRGEVVAVLLAPGADLVAAWLGVLAAGAAYLPLDPATPAERLAVMLEDCTVGRVVTDAALVSGLPAGPWRPLLFTDATAAGEASPSVEPPPPELHDADLAYVVYTSGSTGRPKGVEIPHGALARRVAAMVDLYSLAAADRLLQFVSPAFDAAVEEVFPILAAGGALAFGPAAAARRVEDMPAEMTALGVTVLHMPPPVWRALGDGLAAGTPCPASLRLVVTGGESTAPEWLAPWRRSAPGVSFVNAYGPSEATVTATAAAWPGAGKKLPRRLPMGRPLAGVRVYVLDGDGRLLPAGAVGELALGGAGLARGYRGRPARTALSFRPDALAAEPGARLYLTGDRVRFRADGELELLGRVDGQIKLRGVRMEPGDVEAALLAHPAVAEAAVVVRRGAAGEPLLAAHWVAAEDAEAAPQGDAALTAELTRHLAAKLPPAMVPALLERETELPRLLSGKVDRRALAARPVAAASGEEVDFSNATARAVAALWSELLGVPRVGPADDFFRLGGHSLVATRVVSRLRRDLGVELPLRALFEAPTPNGLAAAVEAARRSGGAAEAELVPVDRDGGLPLSFAQGRMWFLDRLEPGQATYNVPQALPWYGELSPPALAAAFAEVVRRHEVLRTVYRQSDAGPRQVVLPPAPPALPVVDLGDLPPARRRAEARRLAAAEAQRPFDLESGPVLRASLLRLAADSHLLLVTLHHIATDGWSMILLHRELTAAYAAFAAGRRPALPRLPVQYADYAAWQRRRLSGEALEREVAWWRNELAGLPPLLDLPTDRPRRPLARRRAGRVQATLPATQAARLSAFGEARGATLFMTLLAALQGLLGRWSGQSDLAVGSPVAGRDRVEVEPLVGFFVNTLVLRGQLATAAGGELGFGALVERARERVIDVQAHAGLPFEKLVEELAPERSLDHTPLFQVTFALHTADLLSSMQPQGATQGRPREDQDGLGVEMEAAKFDLLLTAAEEGAGGRDGVSLTLAYARDLFDAATARRLLDHLGRLLSAAVEAPERPLSTLPLASAAERQQVSREWPPGAPWDGAGEASASVPKRFAARCAERPAAPALSWDGGALTYAELDERSARLAAWLAERGVGRGDRVALSLRRSPDLVVALLAVLRAGAAYVSVDPEYPPERLAFLLADSRAALVLTDAESAPRLGAATAGGAPRHDLTAALAEARELAPAPPLELTPEDLAYVAYTSGSTGRPKGVAVPHRGVLRLAEAGGHATLGPDVAFLLMAPVSFDASTLEIWGPLLTGGRVAVAPPGRLALADVAAAVKRHGVTSLWLTAGLFQLMVDDGLDGFAPLREVLTGGDVLSPDHARRLLAAYPELRLGNMYGPTENTTFTTGTWLDASLPVDRSAPLGRPIGGSSTYVVDRRLQPLPVLVAGELVSGGDGVARGYLGRPALTAERFVPDPFSGRHGARLYRTGDRARWLPGGELDFLGRLDQQVKIRGFRVEPGEIEALLGTLPGVRECAVVARGEAAAEKVLAAYWTVDAEAVAAGAPRPDAAALRQAVLQRLPDWMVPTHFVELDALPLNANGKLERRALPDPELADAAVTPPRPGLEEQVAEIWRQVLGVDEVGRESRFFDLGGHSLLATRVISQVRKVLAAEVELRALFESSSLAAFAARVEEARGSAAAALPPLEPVPRRGDLPLSFAQQRLWFQDQLAGGGMAYNVPGGLRFEGPLAAQALEQAVAEIVRRHEVLRTTFAERQGRPVPVVDAEPRFAFARLDLAPLPPGRRLDHALDLLATEARRPFDLARGPLLRVVLVRLGEDDHALLSCVHHIAADAWSMAVMEREVAQLYRAFAAGRPSPLPELRLQYADFAHWQRNWLRGEALDEQVDYWRRQLAGAPPVLDLPTDRPRSADTGSAGGSLVFRLPPEVGQRLARLAQEEGATLFMVLLAAFQAFLYARTAQRDLVVGSAVANRLHRDTEGLIGFFINMLPMRGDLSGDPTFRSLVGRVRETALGAFDHQALPFERLVEALQPPRREGYEPIFQVAFGLQNAPGSEADLPELRVSPLALRQEAARYDLTLWMNEGREGLGGRWSYRTARFDAASVERMSRELENLLTAVASRPDARLDDLTTASAPRRATEDESPAMEPTTEDTPQQDELIEGFHLSQQQQRAWGADGEGAAAPWQAIYSLHGSLDRGALRSTLEWVVSRHEALRTGFRTLPGLSVPLQVVGDDAGVDLRDEDLSQLAEEARPEALAERRSAEAARSFDLQHGVGLRALLLRWSPREHLLLVTLPALVADPGSLRNLLHELAHGYALETQGGLAPADPVQYIEYSEWQRESRDGEEAEEGREVWRRRLARAVDAELPLPRPAAAAEVRVAVSLGELTAAVEERAAELSAPPAALLLAAWSALLARLAESDGVSVEVRLPGRRHRELRGSFGPFDGPLPVPLSTAGDLPFRDLVARAAASLEEAAEWGETLHRETPPGELGFAFEELPAALSAAGLEVAWTQLRNAPAAGEVRLELQRRAAAGGGEAVVEGELLSGGRLSADDARRLAAAWRALLAAAVEEPGTPLAALPLLGADEARHLLHELNDTARPLADGRPLPLRISEMAAQRPGALALVDGDTRLTFAELEARTNRVGNRLRALGAGPETPVGLLVGRSADALVGLLGIWKAGAAYVPLDTNDPEARLATLLAESGAGLVVTGTLLERLLPDSVARLRLDADAVELTRESDAPPALELLPQHLAYVIHTSGSTGRPKGVMVTHGSLAHLAEALASTVYGPAFGARLEDGGEPLRVGVNAPLIFDASVKQVIQVALGHGLWVVPEEVRPDGAALAEWVARESLDVLDLTPSQLGLALDAGWLQRPQRPRLVLLGGEALDEATWQALAADAESPGGTRWVNVYGPTETTVDASARAVEGAVPSLGAALPNVRLYVVDGHLRPRPTAVPGELLIGGLGVSRGYAGRPAATAERFVPDPFGDEPGGRLYRSGDRARVDAGGELAYLGRLDGQVKVRGLRIELGEIEAALARQSGVRRSAATVREDVAGDARLVGYVVPRRDATPGGDGASHFRLPNGLVVAQQNRNETEYLYQEIFTGRSYLRHGMELPEEPVVFDVGANIGMFTLFVAGHRPGAQVYAFEPIGPIYETLQANARAYAPGAKLFRHGLSSEESTATFSYYPGYSMMSGLAAYADAAGEVEVIERFLRNEQAQGEEGREELLAELEGLLEGRFEAQEETARLRRLADVVAEEGVERIDLLKVDVQRAELDVLRGLDDAAWGKVQQVVMEVHDLAGGATEGRVGEIRALLEGHGFHVLVEQDEVMAGTDRYAVYAARHELTEGAETQLTWQLEAAPERALSGKELREALKAELPDYMVPSAVVVLDELPLTRNGKVDRAALPAPEDVTGDLGEVAAPRTLVEEMLCSLWSEVLHRERVGIDEDFFELGGHSLLATQLVSRVREAFGVEMPLRSLFMAPTPEELAIEVEKGLRTGAGLEAPPMEPADRSAPLPLSFAQQRLWFQYQLDPASPRYNAPRAVRLVGPLDLPALAGALSRVAERHEVLRTVFADGADGAVQVIRPPSPVAVPRIDLTALPQPRREPEARHLAGVEADTPFDLERDSLLRVRAVVLDDDDHVLLFTLHHIVADAWSLGLMLWEVEQLYRASLEGKPTTLPELPLQYADYAAWQRGYLRGAALEAHLDYWRRRLAGAPSESPLPAAGRGDAGGDRGGRLGFRVADDVSAALNDLARQTGTTLFMTLLASFKALLHRLGGSEDLVVGTAIGSRTRAETERLIGFFVNMLALRTDLSGDPTLRELLGRVREGTLGAYAHQELPFEKLVEELRPERKGSDAPIFQIAFGVQNAPRTGFALPGIEMTSLGVEYEAARYDLTLWMHEGAGGLAGSWSFRVARFDEAAVETLTRRFLRLLESVAANPDARLSELEIFSDEERRERQEGQREREAAKYRRFTQVAPEPVRLTEQ